MYVNLKKIYIINFEMDNCQAELYDISGEVENVSISAVEFQVFESLVGIVSYALVTCLH